MSTNLSLSFELICLMGWLLKHNKTELVNLILTALDSGFAEELHSIDMKEFFDDEMNGNGIVHQFFSVLEQELLTKLEGAVLDRPSTGLLVDELKKFDGQVLDPRSLFVSLQAVKKKFIAGNTLLQEDDQPLDGRSTELRSLLFEQVLKDWHPSQQDLLH